MKLFDLYIRILKKQVWLYMIYMAVFLAFIQLVQGAGKQMPPSAALALYYRNAVLVLMVLIMLTISAVTAVTSNVELSMRHRAAPVRIELLELRYVGADLLVMLFWWMLFFWTAVVLYGEVSYSIGGLLMAVDMLTVSLLSTAIGLLIGIFAKTGQGRGIASNLIALVLVFAGGDASVYVAGDQTVYFLRSFTPIFWYQKALQEMNLENYAIYIGIQLMFAVAVLAFGMMLDKQRKEQVN
ncbi:MAG: hypothetical protein J6J86_02465 [Lachnospiraceae bacterium]|nr:hypothetical protein [Lachnospiraceae bacterium]